MCSLKQMNRAVWPLNLSSDHEKIFRINNNLNLKWEDLKEQIEELKILANNGDRESLIKAISSLSKL